MKGNRLSRFASLDRAFASYLKPPDAAKGHYEFARTMRLPDGPLQGALWDPATEPAQLHFIKAIANTQFSIFVNVAPSQRGKTLTSVLMPWLYAVAEEGLPVGYVMPNLDKLAQNWEGKIKPAIIGSGYGGWLPQKGPGSKGGKPAALTMTPPHKGRKPVITYFMAAGGNAKETSLSSVSPARLVIDEADDLETSGHIELAFKRLESWGAKGRAYVSSTVNSRKGRSSHPVLDLYHRPDSSQSRIAHKCPHCQAFQVIEFDQFDVNTARLSCRTCGAMWSEDDRHDALNQSELLSRGQSIVEGKICGEVPNGRCFGLITTGFDFHMADFPSIASTYIAAKDKESQGDFSLMENFSHKVLCRPYEIPADQDSLNSRMLVLRSSKSHYEKGMVPDDVQKVCVGVDVQKNRLYWVAVASGLGNRLHVIDWDEWFFTPRDEHGREVEPTEADRHGILNQLYDRALKGWPKSDGTFVCANGMAVDIGFNPDGQIGRWIGGKGGVMPVRGENVHRSIVETLDGKKTSHMDTNRTGVVEQDCGLYEVRRQEANPGQPRYWWFVKTRQIREHVASRFRLDLEAESAFLLPLGVPEQDYLLKHLTAWVMIRDPDTGMPTWIQQGKRDDYADALYYATAMHSSPRRVARRAVVGSTKK